MEKKEEPKEPQAKWGVGQVAKETKEVLVNENNQPFTVEEALALILNEVIELKEAISKILKKLE